jgi:fatty acid desaturase
MWQKFNRIAAPTALGRLGGTNLSARRLRERFVRDFISMEKYSATAAWLIVGAYILSLAASVVAGAWLLDGGVTAPEGVFVAALMVFVATRFRGLNNIVHECSHASFTADRAENTRVGKVCSAFTLGSFEDYKHEHLSHHAHLGDYEHDLDLQGIEALRLHDPLTPRVILRHLLTPLVLRHVPHYLSVNLSEKDGRAFLGLKIALLALVSTLIVAFPMTAALFLVLPYVVIYSGLNYWADCLDHAGLVPSKDDLGGSRNVLAPRALAWLFFPRNDGYHLVHHLFPNVPARHLPAAHDALLNDSVYRATPNAVRGPLPLPGRQTVSA